VGLRPGSEEPDLGSPGDYRDHHPQEHPSDWGWHAEWGRVSRIAGYVVAAILLLMITSTSYNFSGGAWLIGFAAAIVAALIWDAYRRRNSWRR
jgi:hypothetical protein